LGAKIYSPAQIIVVDNDANRLDVAKKFGATHVIFNELGNAAEKIMALTDNRGVDVAMEAIGIPSSFDICQNIVAVGGHIAVIGVHSQPVQLNLERLWAHNITLTTRLVDTVSTPMLLKTVVSGKLEPKKLITHRFSLDDVMKAYDTFENSAQERALKVLITTD
jgi:alcohol dehydrogenase